MTPYCSKKTKLNYKKYYRNGTSYLLCTNRLAKIVSKKTNKTSRGIQLLIVEVIDNAKIYVVKLVHTTWTFLFVYCIFTIYHLVFTMVDFMFQWLLDFKGHYNLEFAWVSSVSCVIN